MDDIFAFKSYKDIEGILKHAGSPLQKRIAVEMNGLSWALAVSFSDRLSSHEFIPGDKVISMVRGTKTEWELKILREAGLRHAKCLVELLPPHLRAGMTELEIAHIVSNIFFTEGHQGILRMGNYGEEVFLGHISAGDSGNYPSVFNGPLGLRGVHPAVPHMGSSKKVWQAGEPLTIDSGFILAGYQTDKTQVYWLGKQSSIPSEAQAAHNFCIEMQEWISQHLKPGVLPSDLWNRCISWAEKSGWKEGFMGLGNNKVEFVGHGIGLAIDEYPVLAKGFDLPLEKGMVLAIEPKIGIPNFGMVGVENTFEVTPEGGKSLTGKQSNNMGPFLKALTMLNKTLA